MEHQNVPLYKMRDFGAKINATIEYIRYNIGPLLKIVLLIAAPVGLLLGIIYTNTFSSLGRMEENMTQAEASNMAFGFGFNYLLMMLISIVTGAFLFTAVYVYMKLRENSIEKPTVAEVYGLIWRKIGGIVLLMILTGIVSTIGFIFLIVPGVYLAVTLSLAVPIYLFEDSGVGKAFSKSFKLIKGKWWSTFGLLVITMLIAGITSYIFAIPAYAVMFGKMFTVASENPNDPQAVFNIFSSWYSTAGMAFAMVGTYITYLIPIIGLGFQYFNLSERVEGTGIRNQIEGFETVV